MIEIFRYQNEMKEEWDEFVSKAKNRSFMFYRSFIEYHQHRFLDHSLVIRSFGEVLALLPASQKEGQITSHGGLTYGGFITNSKMTVEIMLGVFRKVVEYLRENQIKVFQYRALPHIYHHLPAEEDLYALSCFGARLDKRTVSTTIDLSRPLKMQERRRRGIRRALKAGVSVREFENAKEYWPLLVKNLRERHEVEPVHSLEEIHVLKKQFPQNIRFFYAFLNEKLIAGVVVFETEVLAHLQYISANEEGKRKGALDLLISTLIDSYKESKRFFDFGISTEDGGKVLNTGLAAQKEGFGGRAIVYDTYSLELSQAIG